MSLATLVSGDRRLDGEELAQRAARAAGGLVGWGLVPGDVVAILMRNDFPFLELSLAASSVGVVAIPLNWHGGLEEISYILQDSEAKAFFAHADLLERVRPGIPEGCRIVTVDVPAELRLAYGVPADLLRGTEGEAVPYEQFLASATAYDGPQKSPPRRISYTSGTTGKPKGVVRELPSVELNRRVAERGIHAHGLDQQPVRAAMPGPLYHSAPNVYALNCLRLAEILVLQPRFDAGQLLDIIERHQITHLHAVPTMFSRLLGLSEERKASFDPSSLRAVVHGAAVCPPEIKRAMIEWWGPVILEYYAATEVGIITHSSSQDWLAHPGTVGRPPEGVEVAIFDEEGNALPPGETGEIMFKSDLGQFVSYHRHEEANAEFRRGDWLTLGDIGHMNEQGFLWITDRKKDMIISGGVNIFPSEIEDVILSSPDVADCAVFGVPDKDLGEAMVAYVVPHEGRTADVEVLAATIREALGRLKTPRLVRIVDGLPRQDSGKIAKRRLRQDYLGERP